MICFLLGNQPLDIFISFDIFMLSEFLEVSFSYQAKFLITVKWYDHRLEFANLMLLKRFDLNSKNIMYDEVLC